MTTSRRGWRYFSFTFVSVHLDLVLQCPVLLTLSLTQLDLFHQIHSPLPHIWALVTTDHNWSGFWACEHILNQIAFPFILFTSNRSLLHKPRKQDSILSISSVLFHPFPLIFIYPYIYLVPIIRRLMRWKPKKLDELFHSFPFTFPCLFHSFSSFFTPILYQLSGDQCDGSPENSAGWAFTFFSHSFPLFFR